MIIRPFTGRGMAVLCFFVREVGRYALIGPGVVPGEVRSERGGSMNTMEFVLVIHAIAILWRTIFGSPGQRQ